MNLFGKKKAKEDNVYVATPKFYEKNGSAMGVYALTEGVDTSLPVQPMYSVDGKPVENWRILFVSTTLQRPLGDMDYFAALQKMEPYITKKDKQNMIIRKMTLDEINDIMIQK